MVSDLNQIQVVYCAEDQHYICRLAYREGLTAQQAIDESGISDLTVLPEVLQVGVFSLKISNPEQYVLSAGDRVEIYRPLKMNPKDVRRKRATENPVGNFRKGNQWNKKQKSTE